jgi:hypothetical protein
MDMARLYRLLDHHWYGFLIVQKLAISRLTSFRRQQLRMDGWVNSLGSGVQREPGHGA